MNYIRELNAFKDWLLLNEMPTSEIVLWHSLMLVNNMCRWQTTFSVANSRLQHLTGLSKQGLDNARSGLKSKGFIDYEKGQKKKPGKYRVISLVKSLDQYVDLSLDLSLDQSVDLSLDQALTITKQNKTKTSPPSIPNGVTLVADSYDKIQGKMQVRMVSPTYFLKGKDYESAKVLLEEGVDISFILDGIDKVFEGYKPKGALDRIRNFAYCAPIIEQQWHEKTTQSQIAVGHHSARERRRTPGPESETARDERYTNFYQLFPNS